MLYRFEINDSTTKYGGIQYIHSFACRARGASYGQQSTLIKSNIGASRQQDINIIYIMISK